MRENAETPSNLPAQVESRGGLVAYDPHANKTLPDDDIDLREILRVFAKYKGTIFSVLILVLAIGITATLLMRPVYRAEALLEIKPQGGNIVKFQNLEQSNFQPQEYKTTQENILLSDSVANSVIDKLNLTEEPELNGQLTQRGFITGLNQIIRPVKQLVMGKIDGSEASSPESAVDRSRIELIRRYKNRLSVAPIRKSDLVKVRFESFDPKLSATVANAVVEEYMYLNQQRRFGSTSGAKQFLQKELSRVQAKLETSEKDLTDFARSNQIVDVEERDNIMTTRLRDLNAQLTAVNGERASAEALFEQARSPAGVESLSGVLQDALIQNLKSQYAEIQGEYFRLSRIYKPAYPKLQQLQAEMDKLQSSINAETARIVEGIQTQYEQLKKREVLLAASLEQQKKELLALKDRSIQYNILKREWESNKELYAGLLERMKEVGVAAGMELDNLSLIDRATVPVEAFKPNLKINAFISALAGLGGGIGLAFLLAFLDNTVRNPEDLERVTALNSLGIIPKLDGKKSKRKKAKALSPNSSERLDLISYYERESEISEAFRSIRTSLMFSSPSGMPKTIQVTSSSSGEGKTTIATNLAIVLADNGHRVLLVDADLRKPRIHKIFKVPSAPGLSEFLTAQAENSPIRETKIPNLHFMSAGTSPPNPAELLGSIAMDKFIKQVGSLHDFVIIDSAPLLGLADSVIISAKVDGVIFSVLTGEINKDSLRESIGRLRRVRAPLLGAIMNRMDMNSSEYSYYGEYYQYHNPEQQYARAD